MNHQQAGDPVKFGEAVIKLAGSKMLPVRFAAGSDAYEVMINGGQPSRRSGSLARTDP
jgi:hypothetical protein